MPFTCDICGKSFRSASGLAGHKQIVHGLTEKRHIRVDGAQLMDQLKALRNDVDELRARIGRLDGVFERLNAIYKQVSNELPHLIEGVRREQEEKADEQPSVSLSELAGWAAVGLIVYALWKALGREQP